jgi:serine/threonine protein kinase
MATSKNQTLPFGYILQDYIITKVLSTGGFSFVYLAQDKLLGRKRSSSLSSPQIPHRL